MAPGGCRPRPGRPAARRRRPRPLDDPYRGRAGRALDPDDLRRALLATELAFAGDQLGWGRDWSADSGFTDRDTATLLRSIQERVAYPAWVPMDEEADDVNWYRFEHDFAFRPSTHP